MSFKIVTRELDGNAVDNLIRCLMDSAAVFPPEIRRNVPTPVHFTCDVPPSTRANNFCVTRFPEIERVIYNDPATKVFFKDGTNVLVKTSKDDKFSKEVGLVYAIVKRLFGVPGPNGAVDSNGYMEKLKGFSDAAYDQKAESAKKDAELAAKKAKEKKAKEKKPSGKKPSGKKPSGKKAKRA